MGKITASKIRNLALGTFCWRIYSWSVTGIEYGVGNVNLEFSGVGRAGIQTWRYKLSLL